MFKKFLTVAIAFVIIATCFGTLCFADENIANEDENNSAAGLSLEMNGVERIEIRSSGNGHSGENNYITKDQNEIKYIINTINSFDLIDDGKKIFGSDGRSDSIYVYYNDGSKKFLDRFSGRIYYNDEKQYGIKDLKGIFELISAFKTKEFMLNHEVTFEPSAWAKADVDKAISLGLVPKENRIDYTGNITRLDACRLLNNLMPIAESAEAEKSPFSDTSDENIANLYSLGIINGKTETLFCPYDHITREEFAKTLAKASEVLKIDAESAKPKMYADQGEISDWAKSSIDKTTALGLIEGNGGKFRPKDSITKEEVITILLRLREIIK